ncbi:cylicin-2-like [Pyrus ussuriensis x Pyrus communis]|uniref:Cylicin-2-like n=1 Tax=Pyrus ussuriensis x Pyrus communis TaxID=2448454 RepID=A0A5N5FKN7_9ROSA|nr:cylicin-2-like [Pyrus ussuriensis x Pyrus communis]KAB2603725.1 cylicin-2-like [Pyrus ussuriensis x Pyrus communis]
MDLETENRIAAILMREAAELRRQAEKEGVLAYLQQPKTRFRPNSRLLSATVRGVQQANRVVEVNEMWRLRQKEKELDNRLKGNKDESRCRGDSNSPRCSGKGHAVADDSAGPSCSSRKREYESCHSRQENGLGDEELEEFLHSRVKRGRGAVGSRMDEKGPYLPHSSDSKEEQLQSPGVQERRAYGPERPSHNLCYPSEEEHDDERKKSKKVKSGSPNKHKSKEKSKEKKRKDEKRNKYHT